MSEPASIAPSGPTLEATLTAWEQQLGGLERQAQAVLRAAHRLRKAAQEGAVAGFASAIGAVRDDAAKLQDAVGQAANPPAIDVGEKFANGTFLAELAEAAAAANVTLVQRDGRVTAYPVVLRLEPRGPGVRIGRRLERRIRPSFLAAQLRALQQRPNRFNARGFLDRLFKPYQALAAGRAPDWRANRPGEGPLVPFVELHELLTLLPAAAADYPVEELLCDLLRLDRQPDSRTGRGHRFQLGGSTGTKGARRLTIFDETGAQHDYYAIRFVSE
jgi:hypothetical protein